MRRVQLVVVALALAGCGADEKSAITVPGERGFLYDVGGELIYLECAGSGGPTVVLEAGLAGDHRDWNEVMPDLEARGRVCSYDRSGIGYSQVGTRRATAAEKVRDLHDLLVRRMKIRRTCSWATRSAACSFGCTPRPTETRSQASSSSTPATRTRTRGSTRH